MPPSPPKKKPVVDDGFSSAFDQAVAPVLPKSSVSIGAVKDDSFSAAFDAALSKKKVGTADVGIGANTTSSPSTSSSEAPLPSTNIEVPKYDISTLNGVIQPQGTFTPKPSPVRDLITQLKEQGSMENGVITVHDNTQSKSDLPDIKEAIDETVQKKIKTDRGVDVSSPVSKYEQEAATKIVTDAYKRGDLVLTKDRSGKAVLKRGTGFVESIVNGIDQVYNAHQENEYFTSLTNTERAKYLNLKRQYPEILDPEPTTAPSGITGKSGAFMGENALMLSKVGVASMVAPIAVPEAISLGAGNVGGFLSLINDTKGGFKNNYEKVFYALKEQGLSDEEAADKAEIAGLKGQATQLVENAVFTGTVHAPDLTAAAPAVNGLLDGIVKSAANMFKKEVPKMAAISAVGSVADNAAVADAGVKVDPLQAMKEAVAAAGDGAILAASFWALHEPARVPSYLRPQFENVAASVPVEAREELLNKAVEAGVSTPEQKIEVSKKINQFGETKKAVSDLPIPEEKKAAITGKLVQAKNIQEERDNLLKYGSSFNDRVAQLDAQINEMHSDVNKMYGAEDVFALEQDRLTGEKPVTEPAVVMPNEVSRPAETTIAPDETLIPEPQENKGAAVILPQSNKEPNIINDESNRGTNTDTLGQVAEPGKSEGQQAIEQESNNVSNERQSSEESKPTETAVAENKQGSEDEEVRNYWKQTKNEYKQTIEKNVNEGKRTLLIGSEKDHERTTFEDALKEKKISKKFYDNNRWGGLSKKQHLQMLLSAADTNHPFAVKQAIKEGRYIDAIDKGEMRALDAKNIIESAGVEVPKNILDKINEQNSITSNTTENASSKSEMQQQEVPKQSSQGEHTRTVPQRNMEAVNEANSGDSLLGSEGRKAKISRTKASANLRSLSSKIREEGILPHWAKADVPEGTQKMGFGGKELDEAVARSLELVADAIDAGKGFADSVNEGFSHIKDYYEKNTKFFDEKKLKQQFKENIKSRLQENRELSGITHAETENTRKEFALGDSYEKTVITDKELRDSAIEKIKNGYDVKKLVSDLEKGKNPSAEENAILKLHKANLEAQIEKNPTDENLAQLRDLVKASDAAGSRQGRDLRSRQGLEIRDDSLAGYFTREQDIHGDEPLSEQQKKQVIKEHTEISETQKKLEEKLAALEKENARIKAEKKLKEQSAKVTDKSKKTKEDFVKERNDILQSIKEKWKNAGKDNTLTAVPIPYVKQLAAIAPDVAKLVRSLVEEGVTKLADVTKNVHETLKESFPEITEKDVHDIIAGEYNQNKKPTKNEVQQKISDLRTQAQLVNKLEELQKGPLPKTEKEKVQRTKEIEDFKKQIEAKYSEHRVDRLETELQRLRDRKEKVTDAKSKKEISDKEQEVLKDISKEKRIIGLEGELQRLKERKIKEKSASEPLSAEEQKLSDEIKKARQEWRKERADEISLSSIKSRTKTEIKKLEEQLKTGDFEKEKDPVKLDKEAIDLKDKLIKLRQEREVRIMKKEYDKMTAHQKDIDAIAEVANVPRTLMSSVDYSAPLRQSVVATVAHPHIASKAAIEMFRQSISQKRFDRWFFDLKESPRYKLMEQSGLYVADPHDPRLTVKEEAFMNNLAEKIPFFGGEIKFTGDVNLRLPNKVTREGIEFGKKVKLGNLGDKGVKVPFTEKRIKSLGGLVVGSERAYVGYLNKMRVDLFNHFSDAFEDRGFTFEKNPEIFKSIASFVNNSTGRGNLGPIESAAPILNSSFFSPRLIVSRFNLLGLSDVATFGKGFYGKMPKEVRIVALKDMAKFVGTGLSVLGLLRLSSWASGCKDPRGEPCLTVEYDPRSTDFGKIKSGNTRWDIWGGMQQYVRIVSQMLTGQSKSTRNDKIQELNGEGIFGETRGSVLGGFVRGKLAPIPSMALDALTGRTATGEKVNLKDEAMQHLLPLLTTDMEDAIKDRGIKAILNVGIPSTFGVGVSTYLPRGYEKLDVKKDPVFKFLYERNMQLSPPSLTNIPEDKVEAFTDKRQELFKKEWHNVLEYGAMIDSKGHPTTDARKGVKIKPKDDLTYDDMAGLMKSISTKSARRAKKALGIETD